MKIIAIGRNYAAHVAEMKSEKPTEPVIFTKPDSAVLRNNDAFYYPDFTQNIHYEVEVVLRVCKPGKHIAPEHADRYFDQIALGLDLTARDLQSQAKEKGLPWALAKGFDGSAPLSALLPRDTFPDLNNLDFRLEVNGEVKQQGNTSHMLFGFQEIIAYVSRYITLKTGDLIFTGTPEGVGPLSVGDRLRGYLEDRLMFDFEVK